MRLIPILTFLFVLACSSKHGSIDVPDLGEEFYKASLKKIAQEYSKSPTRELLLQKLYYQERLDWPEDALVDLKEAERLFGLTTQIVHYYCDYFYLNHRFYELLDAVSVAKSLEKPDERTLQYELLARAKISDPFVTTQYLRRYLSDYQSPHSLEFGIQQYLLLGDTVMAVYYLNKLQRVRPGHQLNLDVLVPSLIALKYKPQAQKVLMQYAEAQPEKALEIASQFVNLGDVKTAKSILRASNRRETTLQLASIFRSERLYDSSIYHLDKVILEDSSSQLLLLKGEILEERGWLTSSYFIYQFLAEEYPNDSIAVQHVQNVERKIAYLRRVKEANQLAPILKIEPTKLTE